MLYGKACVCQYDGTNYSGWQRQKNGRAVQEIMETALEKIYGEPIKIAGCGRTDAKVHSMGQVFSFRSNFYRESAAVIRGANAYLPADMAVTGALDVIHSFHAGKDAVSKTYLYKIINSPVPAPLYINRALWVRMGINEKSLGKILKAFEGKHDFASFCVKKTKKENTVRTVNFTKVTRKGQEVNIEINAGGFLHNMVRIIVGTSLKLLQKGEGPEKILEILKASDRREAGPTAPPYALYQKEAFYGSKKPGIEGIPVKFRLENMPG